MVNPDVKTETIRLSINGLVTGIDNLRIDVRLSPELYARTDRFVLRLISTQVDSDAVLGLDSSSNLARDRTAFEIACREVLIDAVNRAKALRRIQIDHLAQLSIVCMFQEILRNRMEYLIDRFSRTIREQEIANNFNESNRLKKELNDINRRKRTIRLDIGKELFRCFADIQTNIVDGRRESTFGKEAVLPGHLFQNPMLYAEALEDDVFLLEEYDILFGRRLEDPDRYDALAQRIDDLMRFFTETSDDPPIHPTPTDDHHGKWMMHPANIDVLFNYFETEHRLKTEPLEEEQLRNELKATAADQKKRLETVCKRFVADGLMKRVVATYEIRTIYKEFCPPLVPHLILQYMVVPKSRREIENRLRQLRPYYGNQLTSKPLKKRARDVKKVRKHLRKLYLLRFLSGFLHYHRDFNNYHMIREVAGCINLLHDERLISLSRTNHTLYEFLLDHERGNEENPISNHVILKADIRGSTDITHTMIERGLNPATHFSLNLFDPITEILSDYNAEKVFVEGDAMILALFDREDSPKDRYAVARACGLAVTILSIVRRYNTKNRKNNLPIIELGIGICYTEGRPAFLFDGEHRIMISPAINQADRLSSCSKRARRKITGKGPFNLYVLQTASEAEMKKTKDDLSFRYNVNGIELNSGGFKKLSKEIDLRNVGIQFPGVQNSHVRLYTGKFPDLNGRYQRLLIREARIPRVRPLDLGSFEMTKNTFYEVCTNAKLYAYVNKVVENK